MLFFLGKTSIIEALKFVTTGVQPPLSDSGKRFVIDPKVAGKTVVKAAIKLTFSRVSGQTYTVEKRFQVSQAKATSSYKLLDTILKIDDPITKKSTVSNAKSSDITASIPVLMGASPAI